MFVNSLEVFPDKKSVQSMLISLTEISCFCTETSFLFVQNLNPFCFVAHGWGYFFLIMKV